MTGQCWKPVRTNMRLHQAKIVKWVLDEWGIKYLYLPPYNPDLNPIEKMWSKLKSYLRKEKSPNSIGTSIFNQKGIFHQSSFGLFRVVSFV